MRTKLFFQFSLIAVFLFCFTLSATAQRRTSTRFKTTTLDSVGSAKATTNGISAADQKAIRDIFRGVSSSKYRLQFNGGRTTYGSQKVSMTDVQQVKRVTNPVGSAGYIVLIVEGKDVIYVLAVGSSELTSVIGKEKAQRLNQIMAKYRR